MTRPSLIYGRLYSGPGATVGTRVEGWDEAEALAPTCSVEWAVAGLEDRLQGRHPTLSRVGLLVLAEDGPDAWLWFSGAWVPVPTAGLSASSGFLRVGRVYVSADGRSAEVRGPGGCMLTGPTAEELRTLLWSAGG